MIREKDIFSITPEAVRFHNTRIERLGKSAMEAMLLQELGEVHPHLLRYVTMVSERVAEDVYLYGNGFLTTYSHVARQMEINCDTIDLTEGDLLVHDQDIKEQEVFNNITNNPKRRSEKSPVFSGNNGIDRFLRKLEASSPEFGKSMKSVLANENVYLHEKLGFSRGIYDGFMPFYKKYESKYLYEHLVLFPELAQAFDSGRFKYHNQLGETPESFSSESDTSS